MSKSFFNVRLRRRLVSSAVICLLGAGILLATEPNTPDDALQSVSLLGIGSSSAHLVIYDFATATLTDVGEVADSGGQPMTGVEAAAYFPDFHNLFALWTDPADGNNKLVYVNATDASTAIVADDVEGGHFTGAVGLSDPLAGTWTMYAVQDAKIKPPSTIVGTLNLNPNNVTDNEFSMTKESGGTITRDTLTAGNLTLPANGVYYEGGATLIHIKPKGTGNQNSLTIDGEPTVLQNSNTYDFSGAMQVRVYNDHVQGNGKAVGNWWIQIVSGEVYVNDTVKVLFPNRIVTVNQQDGAVNEIMTLSRSYRGLATADGSVFYTTSGDDLYRIDTAAQTETQIGTTALNTPSDCGFAGVHLFLYDIGVETLGAVSAVDATNTSAPTNYGLNDLSVITFTPVGEYPVASKLHYD